MGGKMNTKGIKKRSSALLADSSGRRPNTNGCSFGMEGSFYGVGDLMFQTSLVMTFWRILLSTVYGLR